MNRISHHSLAILATCLVGASNASLYAASFSDAQWTNSPGRFYRLRSP